MVRLYLAACSEVDVVAGLLCDAVDPEAGADKIHQYRALLRTPFPEIEKTEVLIPRYGLRLRP